jgi:hypothetical protein
VAVTNFGLDDFDLEWLDNNNDRDLAEATELPAADADRHEVGLKLFDIFMTEDDDETDLDLERLDTDDDRDLLAATGLPPGEADRCGIGLELFDVLGDNGGFTTEFN